MMGYFSNGTEGEMFEERWCSRCVHSDISGDREVGVDPPCPVWMAHMLYAYDLCNKKEYPGKVILDMLIPDERPIASDGLIAGPPIGCAMFHPIDAGAAIYGQGSLLAEHPEQTGDDKYDLPVPGGIRPAPEHPEQTA